MNSEIFAQALVDLGVATYDDGVRRRLENTASTRHHALRVARQVYLRCNPEEREALVALARGSYVDGIATVLSTLDGEAFAEWSRGRFVVSCGSGDKRVELEPSLRENFLAGVDEFENREAPP